MSIQITDIFVYPVKSLRGVRLKTAEITERGVKYDRRWMIVDEAGKFMTQRNFPQMATLSVDVSALATDVTLSISTPEGKSIACNATPSMPQENLMVTVWKDTVAAIPVSAVVDQWLSAYLGQACRLVYMPESTKRQVDPRYADEGKITSFADGYPLLLANESSLEELNNHMPAPAVPAQFRPNLIIKGAPAFAEDNWGTFRIGDAVFEAVKNCTRCEITRLDPVTGLRIPDPRKALVALGRNSEKGTLFGENLVVMKPGKIRVGDEIEFLKPRDIYPLPTLTPCPAPAA
jgi:uncharacterized protein YcbX